jgi:hypothetical protein
MFSLYLLSNIIQENKYNKNIILGWIFRKWDVGVWTGLGWLRIETSGEQL